MERLAHGGAGDPERVGELSLPQPGARLELAVLDHRPDTLVGEIHHRVGLDSLDLHRHDVQHSERNEP
jgi:hypothetical protein